MGKRGRFRSLSLSKSQQIVVSRSRPVEQILTPPFGAIEQYGQASPQGPFTDIYAMARRIGIQAGVLGKVRPIGTGFATQWLQPGFWSDFWEKHPLTILLVLSATIILTAAIALVVTNCFKLFSPKSSGIFRRSRRVPLPEPASLTNL
jgi:hypothetical protein